MKNITAAQARLLLRYDPQSGDLFWRERSLSMFKTEHDRRAWNSRYADKVAGTPHGRGYIIVNICGIRILAHRLIWLIVHGIWPDQIDHENGIRSDNRLLNLRDVCGAENQKNMRRPKRNLSGVIGVCWASSRGKWLAQIKVARKNRFLGHFDDFDAAVAARKAAERSFGFHPNHGRAA